MIYTKIFILTNNLIKQKKLFSFSKKRQSQFVLNKSVHVHKKAKEHFIFFWPRKGFYITPVFIDSVSINKFLCSFIKKTAIFHNSVQLVFKKVNLIF